jgi:hypothetical protein
VAKSPPSTQHVRMQRGPLPAPIVDAVMYAASAVAAYLLAHHTEFLLHRRWGDTAAPVYAAAAVVAVVVAVVAGRTDRPLATVRLIVLAFVVAGVTIVPLAHNVDRRADRGPGGSVLSEAIVVEAGGAAIASGHNPYAVTLDDPAFAQRHPAIRHHFPYLPAMAAFGLPRAWAGAHRSTDARVVFALFALLVVVLALRTAPSHARLLATGALVLFALPPGALSMSSGGDDLPVLALLLLAVTFVAAGRSRRAGLVLGLAMALKQLAWPVALLLGWYVWRRDGAAGRRLTAWAAAIVVPVVVPFLVWHPSAFVDDVVRYPLGLTKVATVAASPTFGRTVLAGLLPLGVVVGVAGAVVLLVLFLGTTSWARASLSRVVLMAGIALGVAVVVSPASRFGLLAYPLHLATCALLTRS